MHVCLIYLQHEFTLLGDPELRKLKQGERIQLQRRGYYIVDSPYVPLSPHTGRETPIVLINIPDGHTKDMPKFGGKHKESSTAPKGGESAKEVSVGCRVSRLYRCVAVVNGIVS